MVQETPKVRPADGSLTRAVFADDFGECGTRSLPVSIEGLEKQATETQQREVQYGGLPAGNYEFWVQCRVPGSRRRARQRRRSGFRCCRISGRRGGREWRGDFCCWDVSGGLFRCGRRTLNRRRVELEKAVAQRSAELLQKNKELEEISLTDPLTGTRNRRYFYETISTDIAQALRSHLKTTNSDDAVQPGRS